MAASKKASEAPPPGLSRLPPGRHGLSREFVKQNQRDRLTAGIIAAVAEHGYSEVTISQIVAAAGLSRRTFYGYYKTKEACYLSACAEIVEHLKQSAQQAAIDDAWPEVVRDRLEAVLEIFVANPNLATFLLIAPNRSGGEDLAARYSDGLDQALAALTEGSPTESSPSDALKASLIGGVVAILVSEVEAGRGSKLAKLLPDLTQLVLTPYLGREGAFEFAQPGA